MVDKLKRRGRARWGPTRVIRRSTSSASWGPPDTPHVAEYAPDREMAELVTEQEHKASCHTHPEETERWWRSRPDG